MMGPALRRHCQLGMSRSVLREKRLVPGLLVVLFRQFAQRTTGTSASIMVVNSGNRGSPFTPDMIKPVRQHPHARQIHQQAITPATEDR